MPLDLDLEFLRRLSRVLRDADPYLVPFLFGFTVCVLLTRLSMVLAHRVGALAHPNHRTLHLEPTPRLGGLGVGGAVLLGIGLMAWRVGLGEPHLLLQRAPLFLVPMLLWGGVGALLLGLMDDLFDLSVRPKLLGQLVVALLAAAPVVLRSVRTFEDGRLTAASVVLDGVLVVLSVGWIVTFLNVANFMDGIDGQAGLFSIVAALALLLAFAGSPADWDYPGPGYHLEFLIPLVLLALGASLGFLMLNYPPARTFLGDTGSHFLGYFWGALTLYLALYAQFPSDRSGLEVAAWEDERVLRLAGLLLLFGPLFYDFYLTLTRRLLGGHSLSVAHREHLYQRLVLSGLTHAQVFRRHVVYYGWNALMGVAVLTDGLAAAVRWGAAAAAVGSWLAYTAYVEARVRREAEALAPAAR